MPLVVEYFDRCAKNAKEQAARKPKVVAIIPANGAEDVDPGLTEMRITFDRRMKDGAWSIVQMTSNFPHLTGKPHYDREHRVLTVGIRLEPNRQYELWLNSGQYSSFMSEEGVPLDSVAIRFKTRGK
jgi:hypothetical protein